MQFGELSLLVIICFFLGVGNSSRELARGKNTSASILHAQRWNSSNVVDGNNNTNIFCDSCLHTKANGEPNAWWQVDLGAVYRITKVEMYSREPYRDRVCPSEEINYPRYTPESDRFKGYSIFISNTSDWTTGDRCYKEPSGPGEYPDLYQNNSCVGYGSYLTIYTDHRATYNDPNDGQYNGACLTICEVKVHGCENGFYGQNCTEKCHPNCLGNTCDPELGDCFQCEDGWIGSTCNEPCSEYSYGRNCSQQCGNCDDGISCINTNGSCPNGCSDGWIGIKCDQACGDHFFGRDCTSICGECRNNASCIHTNGTCPMGCEDGYTEDLCNMTCPGGTYGYNCSEMCGNCLIGSTCHHVNGECTMGCADGWLDLYCNTSCPLYSYGADCNSTCGLCRDNESCVNTNGTCTNGCEAGYSGHLCKAECLDYKYGTDCVEDCGNCRYAGDCNHVNGTCMSGECQDGWQGSDCKTACPAGDYGFKCESSCGQCFNDVTCDHRNGSCLNGCQSGYKTPLCKDECDNGYYGRNCGSQCFNCIDNETCNKNNGSCVSGCQQGWTGETCYDQLGSTDDNSEGPSTTVIAVAVSITVLMLLIAIVATVLFLRKRKQAYEDRPMGEPVMFDNNGTTISYNGESPEAKYQVSEEEKTREATPGPDVDKQKGQSNQAYSSDFVDTDVPNSETVYSNMLYVTREIPIADMKAVIDEKRTGNVFQNEFEELPTGLRHPHEIGKRLENKTKNRFISTFPYDHSLVRLREIDDDPNSIYINANFIGAFTVNPANNKIACYEDIETPNAYIATQGPKRDTVEDFWRMIWETEAEIIVMLTNLVEVTRTKCFRYWPDKPQKILNLEMHTVQLRTVKTYGAFTIRSLTLTNKMSDESRDILQFHFTSWPDHGTPDPMHLVIFHHVFNSVTPRKLPVVVHCSAGIGRTGTFIALDALLNYGRQHGKINVFKFVEKMRGNRVNLIQTLEQYVVLHEVLMEAFLLTDTAISKYEFSADWKKSQREDVPINKRRSRIEFQLLADVRPKIDKKSLTEALSRENKDKNRDLNHIPVSKYRPFIWSLGANQSSYVNATTIPSLKNASAFITTQCPLPETAEDFWCMVYDQKSSIVVVLEPREHVRETESFLPTNSEKRAYGIFTVEASPMKKDLNGFSEREMSLFKQVWHVRENKANNSLIERRLFTYIQTMKLKDDMLDIKRIKILEASFWSQTDALPTNAEQFLALVLQTKKEWEMQLEDGPVTVVCLYGTTKCGLFCAVHNILERIDETNEVDVASAVRQIQLRRPQAIATIEQYEQCYSMVQTYFDSNAIYVNF